MRMRFITFFKECSPRSSSTKSSGILATDRRSSPWAPLTRHILSPEAGPWLTSSAVLSLLQLRPLWWQLGGGKG
jgi:hypothetical protein